MSIVKGSAKVGEEEEEQGFIKYSGQKNESSFRVPSSSSRLSPFLYCEKSERQYFPLSAFLLRPFMQRRLEKKGERERERERERELR